MIATKVSLGESAMLFTPGFATSSGVVVDVLVGFLVLLLLLLLLFPSLTKRQYVDVESNFGDSAPSLVFGVAKGEYGKNNTRFASTKLNRDTQPRASPHSNIYLCLKS